MINKKLDHLLKGIAHQRNGNTVDSIEKIEFDSRKIQTGDIFVAISGTQADGHKFIDKAIDNGAAAIVCEGLPEKLSEAVDYILVENSAAALGWLAANYFGHPSHQLKLVGVTGTNGKTTTVTLLYDLFRAMGYKCGMLSTIDNRINDRVIPATHTTPDPVSTNRYLDEMVAASCDFVFMEVSSHAMVQKRVEGLKFAGGIFSNITHDHLDYHKTFKAYIEAKKSFFDQLPAGAFALTNIDDKRGMVMMQNTRANVYTYSLQDIADFRARIMENAVTGLTLKIDAKELIVRLIGEFNAYNLLAVYAAARLLGQEEMEVLTALSQLKAAEGRFDYVMDKKGGRIGIVDYAHTPDALEKVLKTIEDLKGPGVKVYTLVGCGGDRDKDKRPIMARTAARYSDQLVLTSDNPRTEDPGQIIKDMEKGLEESEKRKTLVIEDRKQAIRTACRLAQSGDIILVAGKGHEKYQEINGVRHPFDDKAVLGAAFEEL